MKNVITRQFKMEILSNAIYMYAILFLFLNAVFIMLQSSRNGKANVYVLGEL
jgi:hypothetical protein